MFPLKQILETVKAAMLKYQPVLQPPCMERGFSTTFVFPGITVKRLFLESLQRTLDSRDYNLACRICFD